MNDTPQDNQLQLIISDMGTRIRELEERTSSIKERMLLLNENLIDIKEEFETKTVEIEKQNNLIVNEIKKMNSSLKNILDETNNFVRKDEIVLIERMLKDFQPLEFVRKKDLEETRKLKEN